MTNKGNFDSGDSQASGQLMQCCAAAYLSTLASGPILVKCGIIQEAWRSLVLQDSKVDGMFLELLE